MGLTTSFKGFLCVIRGKIKHVNVITELLDSLTYQQDKIRELEAILKEERRKREELEKVKENYNELIKELEKEKEKSRKLQLELNEARDMIIKLNKVHVKSLNIEKRLNEEKAVRTKLEEEIREAKTMIFVRDEEIRRLRKHIEEVEGKLRVALGYLSELLEEKILNYLVKHNGTLSLRKCADELSISEELLKEALRIMHEKGIINLSRDSSKSSFRI